MITVGKCESINKNADSPEERKWSFVLSTMDGQSGGLYTSVAASLHQAAAGSSERQQHLLQNLFHIHRLFHLSSGYKQPILDAN